MTSTSVGFDVEVVAIDARGEIFHGLEDHGASFVNEQLGAGRSVLDDGGVGGEVAAQHRHAAGFLDGFRA